MINEPQVKAPTTMSVGLKWGLIMTAASIVMFVIRAVTSGNPFDRNAIWTVAAIAVSVGIIVMAQREFKTSGDGYMTYGQGFMIGFWISVISVIAYGIFVVFYANVIDTNVMENMYNAQREQMEAQGNMPAEQVDMAIEWTRKLFWPLFFVVGIFFSLITVLIITIFTQKTNPNPAL